MLFCNGRPDGGAIVEMSVISGSESLSETSSMRALRDIVVIMDCAGCEENLYSTSTQSATGEVTDPAGVSL